MKNDKASTKSKKKKVTPPPAKRGVRLKGPKDVNRLLNRLISEVLNAEPEDEIRVQNKLRTVAYAMSNYLKALETGELAERITKIEEHIQCQQSKADSKKLR